MARNNLTWVKGDITGDIYYDLFKLDNKDIQYLRLYLMVKGVFGAAGVNGLRVCVYGPLAELVYGHVRKGSRLGVIGHLQQRKTRKGVLVFEVVAEEVEFLRNIEWETGERVRKDLVQRGLPRHGPPTVFTDEQLEKIKIHMLLLIGDHEVIYNSERVIRRATRLMPNLKAEIVPNANHNAQYTSPDFVNQKILQFLFEEKG
jgi:pimeloyl-ACP methyl ester carboxylesterase